MADRLKNVGDLGALRDRAREALEVRDGVKGMQVNVHMGTCGIAAGAREVIAILARELSSLSIKGVTVKQSGCAGLCSQEPMLTIIDREGAEFRYGKLNRQKVREIVREHIVGGNPVGQYLIGL